jgi:hypothetical protein
MAYEFDTRWQMRDQFRVESPRYLYARKRAVNDSDAVKPAASALLQEFDSAMGLRCNDLGES